MRDLIHLRKVEQFNPFAHLQLHSDAIVRQLSLSLSLSLSDSH